MYLVLLTVCFFIAGVITFTKYLVWQKGSISGVNNFVECLFVWFSEKDILTTAKSTHKIKMVLWNASSLLMMISIVIAVAAAIILFFGSFDF